MAGKGYVDATDIALDKQCGAYARRARVQYNRRGPGGGRYDARARARVPHAASGCSRATERKGQSRATDLSMPPPMQRKYAHGEKSSRTHEWVCRPGRSPVYWFSTLTTNRTRARSGARRSSSSRTITAPCRTPRPCSRHQEASTDTLNRCPASSRVPTGSKKASISAAMADTQSSRRAQSTARPMNGSQAARKPPPPMPSWLRGLAGRPRHTTATPPRQRDGLSAGGRTDDLRLVRAQLFEAGDAVTAQAATETGT